MAGYGGGGGVNKCLFVSPDGRTDGRTDGRRIDRYTISSPCEPSLPASMKKIRSKMKALEWTQHFPHYNSMVAMETSGRIWPDFELIQALIHVLITCKYEKNPIKNSGENVMTSFSPLKVYGDFPDAQGQLTPQSLVRSGRTLNSSEMLWMFLLPASMKKIRSKMKALEWTQHFPHYNPMGAICCHGNQSSNPTWSKT